VDEHGRLLGQSRNLAELRSRHARQVEERFAQAETETEALSGLTAWSFGELPELMEVKAGGRTTIGFPALVDSGASVAVRVFDTQEKAAAAHRAGLRRLFALNLAEQVRYVEKSLPGMRELALSFMPLGTEAQLKAQLVGATLERTCMADPLPVDAGTFQRRREEARPRIALVAREFARLAEAILAEHAQISKRLAALKAFPAVAEDVRAQLARLITKDFLTAAPFERLQHFPRYLKAAGMRLDKLRADPARDERLMREFQLLSRPFERERSAHERSGVPDPALEQFRWLLEELRVALFAQELKTPVPVSVKRLQKIWESRAR
jgi:ATP-dependent helicase HrpA